jgi:hypothetical protein
MFYGKRFCGNFTVGRERNIQSGKLHHRIFTFNSDHTPVTICASLSRYFIEWMYLFKTVSADSGKHLVDILPYFKGEGGTASKIDKGEDVFFY